MSSSGNGQHGYQPRAGPPFGGSRAQLVWTHSSQNLGGPAPHRAHPPAPSPHLLQWWEAGVLHHGARRDAKGVGGAEQVGGDGRAPCLLLGQRGLHNEALTATAAAPGAGVLLGKRVWVRAGGGSELGHQQRARPSSGRRGTVALQRDVLAMLSPDGFRAVAGVTATEPPDHLPPAHASVPGPGAAAGPPHRSLGLGAPEDAAEQLALPQAKQASLSPPPDPGRPWLWPEQAVVGPDLPRDLCTRVGAVGPSAQTPDQQRGLGGLRRETPGNQKGLTRGRKREVLAPTSPSHMEERPAGPPAGVSSSGQAGHGQAVARCPLTWRQAWPGHPGQR